MTETKNPNADSQLTEAGVARSKHLWNAIKILVVVIVLSFFIYGLYRDLSNISLGDVLLGLKEVSWLQILGGVFLTFVNYVILAGYDLIAVRYLKKQLSLGRVMIGAVVGYSISNLCGWILGGTAARYRLYSSWGFKVWEVVAFISVLSVTFWLGLFLMAGIAFTVSPREIPQDVLKHVRGFEWLLSDTQPLGYVFLAAVLGYLTASLVSRKPIRLGGQEFAIPPFRMSLGQLAVSSFDFALAAAVFYVIMPRSIEASFSDVLVGYLLGMVVTVTLHIPGGIGVIDLIMLRAINTSDDAELKPKILAALAIYRLIYFILPALVGFALLAWNELTQKEGVLHTIAEEVGVETENDNAPPRNGEAFHRDLSDEISHSEAAT